MTKKQLLQCPRCGDWHKYLFGNGTPEWPIMCALCVESLRPYDQPRKQ